MARPVLLDTDVLIDFLRGYSKAVALINAHQDRIILSSIVVAELYAGVRGGKDDAEQVTLREFISLFRIVPVTADIAELGGLYKRDYGGSHGVGLADAIVAATTSIEDAALKTLNVKHYPMLPSLKSAYRK